MSFRLLFDCFGSNDSFSAFAMPTAMGGEKPLKIKGKRPKAVPGGRAGRKTFGTIIVPARRAGWRGWHNPMTARVRPRTQRHGMDESQELFECGDNCARGRRFADAQNKKSRTISSGA
jgi:hypothetical protein